ncbi:polysaccharide deacetylase family protein [Mucilaginibacter ginsenosidivorax]|uniref:Polysaccharide deacetylase family protein n=1 Tax=Mucilaginibacter ginsenosidivorax TaxID=862126 RepID=A0A5B8W7U4_9SPHI|nr:polysaccharide deacetylase family protein [Mucilaginibacter ginsenosidivorax]QEC79035.1 polysaccharide deacetylase family protein [Mucilaginibacter ginsenosidivorax]
MIFTTSWDDGDVSDFKLQELIKSFGVKGTLYIPQISNHRSLNDNDIKELSNYFEIGAHTITHQNLINASNSEIEFEISESKSYIENIIGKKCDVFSYPYGLFNSQIESQVKKSGFLRARIVNKDFCEGSILNNFHLPTTIQVCRHTKYLTAKFNAYQSNVNSLAKLFSNKIQTFKLNERGEYSWFEIATFIYSLVKQRNGIFHLWGHSWEIEEQNLWGDLKMFFQFVAEDKDVVYTTNSGLFK